MGVVGDFVAALQAGVSVNAVETDTGCAQGEVGVLKTSAVLRGKFFPAQHKIVVPEDVNRVATSVVADRIIISRMNTPALVGESGYVTADEPNLFLPDRLWQTEPSPRPHSQRWLAYWLQHSSIRRLIASGATGTSNSMKNISKETVLSLPIPRTPLPEQQRIAAILMALDDKLDVIARQIEATQTLKQGLMQTLFSRGVGANDADGRWVPHAEFKDCELGTIPAAWSVSSIGSLFEVVERAIRMADEQSYRRVTVKRRYGGIELRDEQRGSDIKVKSQFALEAGDFLISERQIVHGACGIVPSWLAGALVSNEYLVLKAKPSVDVRYFNYLVQQLKYAKYFMLCSQGVDIEKFLFKPKDWLKKLVPVPPVVEQARIADVLATADEKLNALSAKQNELQQVKRGLMQKLLTGEWRVSVDASAAGT
ncbi:restriction endonuclease subunit S [Rhodoferax aquaticus]|uniref:Restriction endonuclease subunit S n=2 Tax=Rhodoferax aquaticus TaxID=2527691 RepID=A0A515EW65_9BURK|nr:restriction endonuclease subunit S [Rhodoferax aquaticus]